MQQWFKFARMIQDRSNGGVVLTNFLPTKRLGDGGMELSAGGYRLLSVPNAGGSSVISEVLSFEVLCKCFCANLKKTEMEVSYFPHGGAMTDYVCDMFQETVGVSVTRAMKFKGQYDIEDATHLLNKKLKGVLQSTRNSLCRWSKQILHVWSTSSHVTHQLVQAYQHLDPEVRSNTVVLVTTATDADYIFQNG